MKNSAIVNRVRNQDYEGQSHHKGNHAYIGTHQCKFTDCLDYKVQLEWWCKTRNVIWEISNHNVQEGLGGRQFDINQQVYPICLPNYHVPEG